MGVRRSYGRGRHKRRECHARDRTKATAPSCIAPYMPPSWGRGMAETHQNNTTELSALAELFRFRFRSLLPRLLHTHGTTTSWLTTSLTPHLSTTTGRISPGEMNAQLASYLRAAWRHLASRHEVPWEMLAEAPS